MRQAKLGRGGWITVAKCVPPGRGQGEVLRRRIVSVGDQFEGAHETVSLDVLDEVAPISINWMDFSLYGNPMVEHDLLTQPCISCEQGDWAVESKNLDSLVGHGG